MKKKFCCLLLAALSSSAFALELTPLPQQPRAALIASELLSRYHYKTTRLDDALSAQIFERYLKALDGEKHFFDQTDVDRLAPLRTRLDDAILNENLAPAFGIFNLYAQRVVERYTYARNLLKDGFDFSQQESLLVSREKAAWPASEAELNDLWRKRVKNDWLRLKLAGKDDKGIVETLDKRYDASIRRIGRLKSEDAFQIFMNAYTTAIEPHTNYLGPSATENFDISMRLSLVGIGAVLQEREEYTTIRELMAGSPAANSGQLKVGDRIVGVAQGEGTPIIDVTGWRLDDTVRLIRGEADSVVVLDILPADAGAAEKHKLVPLVRKKISLEEQAAKKSIIPVSEAGITRRIGVIALPSFYQDFTARQQGERDFKSATRDVERILNELKKEKVDSVLIDLRGNGGGSLVEAIELTGLFIDKGPVVQQRNASGQITVESDSKAGVAWDGPLGVLINRESASASEIFAAAIQDYGRGLIIGEPSYGKGTVQTMIDIDRITRHERPLYGELKMTVAQFFRIDGGTTQLKGVTPDIAFPLATDEDNRGESAFDNALPWTKISTASYVPLGDHKDKLSTLRARHAARIKQDKEFVALQEDIAEITRLRKENVISLNEAERRKLRDEQEALTTRREMRDAAGKANGRDKRPGFRDDGLQSEERPLHSELAEAAEHKNAPDPLLNEAAHILGDEVGLLKPGARLAAKTGARAQLAR
ncbi:carboxy terminal-processing peptidase [Quatrionicoccus australiensis]|uniref:carboxy terminal-processing peptidase n=1 Tax=Quatrionicoccus australiensis TaxID=138118 RepID=UPI001CFA29EB|nr:carboxy terminal-processing peptidase [Quatrionicoccus australiensis]MCB4358833.1 carboxy terminal-processing peptidase [Quatrionicoccus australiensis]